MNRLPPGQQARDDFPRFGLTRYAKRFPDRPKDPGLDVLTPGAQPVRFNDALAGLPQTRITADFHCVTTWSATGLQWGGVLFRQFYEQRIEPLVSQGTQIHGVVFRAQDGYLTSLPLEDLMADDVLIANELNGKPLTIAHGAPMRLVAPAHYGYKSLKHLKRLEFSTQLPKVKRGALAFLDHPRARVAHEERGQWFPGWLLRRLYRPLIKGTEARFRRASVR